MYWFTISDIYCKNQIIVMFQIWLNKVDCIDLLFKIFIVRINLLIIRLFSRSSLYWFTISDIYCENQFVMFQIGLNEVDCNDLLFQKFIVRITLLIIHLFSRSSLYRFIISDVHCENRLINYSFVFKKFVV